MANSPTVNMRIDQDVYDRMEIARSELGWTRSVFMRQSIIAFLLGIPESVDQMAKNLHNVARLSLIHI